MNYPLSLSAIFLASFLVTAIPVEPVDAGLTGYLPSLSWLNPYSYSWPSWRGNTTILVVPKEEFDRADILSNSSKTNTVSESHITNSSTKIANITFPAPLSHREANKVTIRPKLVNDVIITSTTQSVSLPVGILEVPTPAPTTNQVDVTSNLTTEAPSAISATTMFKPGSISSLFTTKKPANSSWAKVNIRQEGSSRVYEVPIVISQIPSQASVRAYDGDVSD